MYFRIRSAGNSFLEGILAPPLELISSMTISGMLASIGLLKNIPWYSNTPFTWSLDALIQLINIALIIASLIDIMRNFYMGVSKPGIALAHLMGEAASLSIMYSIILTYSPVTFVILLLSIFTFATGIIMRVFIEIHTGRPI